MKYRKFRWLFGLMSLALAGLVSIQVFWLSREVDLEKKKFSGQVIAAMNQATATLETGEAYHLITNALIPPDGMRKRIVQDSVIVIHDNGDTLRIVQNHPDVPPPPAVFTPTPPVPPGMMIDDSVFIQNDSQTVVIKKREQLLKNAVKDVWLQYITKNGNAKSRISEKQVADALEKNFFNAGISEPFSFAVYDQQQKKIEISSDSLHPEKFSDAPFKTSLFPSDIQSAGEMLLVTLDDHHARIISALWPQFLISILFTVFLVVVFFMTFREALKQKKLSDIKNDFINNMTHEFKTPIATISLAADTINNESIIGDPENVRKYIGVIKRENKRMNEQVEKVLELALMEKGSLQIVTEEIDLNEMISKIAASFSLQLEAKKGNILLDLSAAPCKINGDAFHLERVFLNLLDNAVKYSKVPPEIKINTTVEHDLIRITIADNGIGISPDEQKRIFERFYRVSTGDIHDVKGFGIGLSYVKTIVEKHNGKIEVASKPGNGSTFIITFGK